MLSPRPALRVHSGLEKIRGRLPWFAELRKEASKTKPWVPSGVTEEGGGQANLGLPRADGRDKREKKGRNRRSRTEKGGGEEGITPHPRGGKRPGACQKKVTRHRKTLKTSGLNQIGRAKKDNQGRMKRRVQRKSDEHKSCDERAR